MDARGTLQQAPFAYQVHKDGRVVLCWSGRPVRTLAGPEARRFLARVAGLSGPQAQLLMARATGNFRRGNERPGRAGHV